MKKESPLFSIVIPTCNRAMLLKHCLRTVSAQTFPSVEIIVQDNASDDETEQVVSMIGDPRIVYKRLPQRVSMRANFEAGLNAASEQ